DQTSWTGGDPISGSINVTVLNANTGERLRDVFVLIGEEPAVQGLYGFTDARGQITLSAPGLVGPVSIHALATGYGNFSWIDIDAEHMMMVLTPHPEAPPDPIPDCPEP